MRKKPRSGNPKPHIITDSQRGHRPCVSNEGPLKPYTIGLPATLHAWAINVGRAYLRGIIERHRIELQK